MWGKNQKPNEFPVLPSLGPPGPAGSESTSRETPAWTYIGAGTIIQGDVSGRENLMIEGQVQGKVRIESAGVEVGAHGRVRADIEARDVSVHGEVQGTIRASERVHIGSSGVVHGNVMAQRVAIEEGAILRGAVEVLRPGQAKPAPASPKVAAVVKSQSTPKPAEETERALATPAPTAD